SIWRMWTNSSASSSACTAPTSTKGPAWAWQSCSVSSIVMEDASGPRLRSIRVQHFPLPLRERPTMREHVIEILLAEDNPSDVRLTLHALNRYNITNIIHVVRDGAEALDFIFCTGTYAQRNIAQSPKVVLLD